MRILLVDDSDSTRRLLSAKLREHGFDVEGAPEATTAAELAIANPPDAVVTDLWMPGISGVQLCRLLRADPATANVPVLLLTASADRRTRFWARCAGATAYVSKTQLDELVRALREATAGAGERPPPTSRRERPRVQERLSHLLDEALYDATIAGEVRALAQHAEDPERLFAELVRLTSDVVSYRWLAVSTSQAKLRLHASPAAAESAEAEARAALGLEEISMTIVVDERALAQTSNDPRPLVLPIRFGAMELGRIAIAPATRAFAGDDERVLRLIASEVGGPMRMAMLVHDTRRLAATDALTGLMNRRAFLEAVDRERSRAERHALPLTLMMIDVDHFKRVNDGHGHDAGDAVLRAIAAIMVKVARKSDVVARWGGEEFVVALAHTAEAGARIAAERLRRAIAEASCTLPNGESLRVTASIGLASATATTGLDELLGRADRALYAAKARGRNRVEVG